MYEYLLKKRWSVGYVARILLSWGYVSPETIVALMANAMFELQRMGVVAYMNNNVFMAQATSLLNHTGPLMCKRSRLKNSKTIEIRANHGLNIVNPTKLLYCWDKKCLNEGGIWPAMMAGKRHLCIMHNTRVTEQLLVTAGAVRIR